MCGFAGIIHWGGEEAPRADLRDGLALLRHRGPDEQRVEFPSPSVGLAHCRLKIIDLSEAAAQPMANESRALWLCFNGEIYNFQELRKELEGLGRRFKSRSDTEVILRGYEEWGEGVVARLDGMFALALWDGPKRQLLLARDRTGKKPLYYWTDGRCLAFGSEIKALRAHSHVPREINPAALPHLLALGYPPPGETCYREIRQVAPATQMRFNPGEPRGAAHRYWELPFPEPDRPVPEQEERLRRLLTEAVRRRLISDVPLGAFLSGGLDSTIVVGLMSSLLPPGSVKTFSIGFEGDARFDETAYARLAAERFRTEHTVFTVPPQPFQLAEKLVRYHDQPFGDSSAIPASLLSELTRSQVTVALTGDGGDELFAGYDRFRAALLAERLPAGAGAVFRRLEGLTGPFHVRSWAGRAGKFLRAAGEPAGRRFLQWSGFFPEPGLLLKEEVLTDSLWEPYDRRMEEWRRLPLLSRLLRLNFETYLPNDLHVKTDRCSMAHGLEARSPFLDTPLIEWAFRLPDSLKLRGTSGKWILRQTFRERVPEPILRRKKAGFGVPLGIWLRAGWRQPLQDLLLLPGTRSHRYLRQDRVARLVKDHLNGKRDNGQLLWLLLTLEIWLRQTE